MDEGYPVSEERQIALRAAWDRAEHHLRRAEGLLRADGAALRLFREWIEHNEQGLALDELAHLGEGSDVAAEFWSLLRLAAEEMELTEADEIHGEAVRIVNQQAL